METHSGSKSAAIKVLSSKDVEAELAIIRSDVDVVGIDEIQFFDRGIVQVCHMLALQGKRVIVAGLDQDYKGKAFETTLLMVPEAERIDKLLAICVECGGDALRNYRLGDSEDRVVQGGEEEYWALCRNCFEK